MKRVDAAWGVFGFASKHVVRSARHIVVVCYVCTAVIDDLLFLKLSRSVSSSSFEPCSFLSPPPLPSSGFQNTPSVSFLLGSGLGLSLGFSLPFLTPDVRWFIYLYIARPFLAILLPRNTRCCVLFNYVQYSQPCIVPILKCLTLAVCVIIYGTKATITVSFIQHIALSVTP